MKKTKKKHSNKINYFAPLCLFFASIIMCIGYAQINVPLGITGYLFAEAQDNVFIIDAVCETNNCDNNKVNYYYETLLDSSIDLGNDANSTVTYKITLFNNSDIEYVYKETIFDETFYDNTNITFFDTLKEGDIIDGNGGTLIFDITFSYVDGSKIDKTILNSYINFLFVPRNEVSIISLVYNDNVIKKTFDKEESMIEFGESPVDSGVVIRCNQNAIPSYINNVISATNISDGTECAIFDTLKESVESADYTLNNMLMIANSSETTVINTESLHNISLDLNGKEYIAGNGIINNEGVLKIFDSLYVDGSSNNTGYMKSCGVSFTNYNKLFVDSIRLINEVNTELSSYSHIVHTVGGETYIDSSYLSSDGNPVIDYTGGNYSFIEVKDSTVKSGSLQESPIYARNSGGYISIINSRLIGEQYGVKTANGGRVYLAGTTIEAPNGDWLSYADEDRLYYTSNNTFINSTTISKNNNDAIAVKNYISTTAEDWFLVKDSNGNKITYPDGNNVLVGDSINIMSYYNYSLDVANGNFASGTNLQLYTLNNTNAQKFMFLASSNIKFNIAPYYAPTLFMDISGASKTDGTNIRLYTQNNSSAQQYSLIKSNNYYKLNSGIGTYVDTDEGTSSVTNNTNVESWTNSSRNSQLWFIEKAN